MKSTKIIFITAILALLSPTLQTQPQEAFTECVYPNPVAIYVDVEY
jgi:hypothetical protein